MMTKVKLISVCDNRKQAWIHSRPGFDHSEIDMEKIGSMDMSLNSLCMLTFEVTSSVLFRDFLFSVRPIFVWARSSRSAPLTTDNLNISYEFGITGAAYISKTLSMIAEGIPQDIARENLPISLSTSYTISMDFRTVCGLIKTIKKLDSKMYDIYGKKFVDEIKIIPGFKDNTVGVFYDNYLLTDDELSFNGTKQIGDILYGSYHMKYCLASQFLRQSNSKVKTSIWNRIKNIGYMKEGDVRQKDKVKVAFYTSVDSYDKLMRLRSHWFADWSKDMWGNIVGDYVSEMDIYTFWEFIPNGNGKTDPYYRDMISRVTGEEHNLPCPIMLEYPQLVYQRLKSHGDNPIIRKYVQLVEAGLIKDNSDNELRRQYVNRVK